MTQNTIGGKRMRHKAGMRRASTQDQQQGRHRIGIFAALGAVAVGALVLAGAITGNMWSQAGIDRAEAARQAEPESAGTAQASATQKATTAVETEAATAKPVEKASAPAKPDVVKAQATRVADGKSDALSPDERIERAVARITAGSTDEKVKKAITVAAREKADELGRTGDTVITAALPDSSAYAPARERSGSSALGALRDFDKSDEARKEEATETEPVAKAPAVESKPPKAAAVPTGPLGSATVSTAVNLRSGMDNKASVVTTVPANAAVQASQNCKNWCEVVYNGHHGYIYKSFIRRTAEQAAAAPAPGTQPASTADAKTGAAAEQGADAGILAQTGDPKALAEAAQRAQGRRQ